MTSVLPSNGATSATDMSSGREDQRSSAVEDGRKAFTRGALSAAMPRLRALRVPPRAIPQHQSPTRHLARPIGV